MLTQGGGVEWLGSYWKWASSVGRFCHHLGKTLYSEDYGLLSMNIKQLLQLECIALQNLSIILLWTYLFTVYYYKVHTNREVKNRKKQKQKKKFFSGGLIHSSSSFPPLFHSVPHHLAQAVRYGHSFCKCHCRETNIFTKEMGINQPLVNKVSLSISWQCRTFICYL